MTTAASRQSASLCFPPDAAFVSVVVDLVERFCAASLVDAAVLSRIKLTSHELTENVIKYSDGGMCVVRLWVQPAGSGLEGATFELETENAVDASKLEKVTSYLASLETATDAELFYDKEIQKSAERPLGSGLGLARIRAEAFMKLSHHAQDGKLRIRASTVVSDHSKGP